MAGMLTDALLQSNRFIVLDRQTVKDVLQEQDLAASGRVSNITGTPLREIEGAELLIKASVTEFEPGSAGAAAGAGLAAFSLPGALIGGLAGGVRQSHVAMVVQVVDTRTRDDPGLAAGAVVLPDDSAACLKFELWEEEITVPGKFDAPLA
jgi:curli biogenesis system outer membrane secretion channel CsgG